MKDKLKKLLKDQDFISLINEQTSEYFNVFDVLGTAEYEIRHSNVLAWLINSKGSHGLANYFMENLWDYISKDHKLDSVQFNDYTVSREGENEKEKIDLIIKSDKNKWLIVIENKIFSKETGNQLDRYRKYIQKKYGNTHNCYFVYLTPEGISPEDSGQVGSWYPVSYKTINKVITGISKTGIVERVKQFIEQYSEHIDKNVLKNIDKIEKQRKILSKHRDLFDTLQKDIKKKYIKDQCNQHQLNQIISIIAVKNDISVELFQFTKYLFPKYNKVRYSGLGTWITITLPKVDKYFHARYPEKAGDRSPIVFVFRSKPDEYSIQLYVYKPISSIVYKSMMKLYSDQKEEFGSFAEITIKKIISSEELVNGDLETSKKIIKNYFHENLDEDIEEIEKTIINHLEKSI